MFLTFIAFNHETNLKHKRKHFLSRAEQSKQIDQKHIKQADQVSLQEGIDV